MVLYVIAFAIVTHQQWKHFLDTECDADEKAVTYIFGTDLIVDPPTLLFQRRTLADDTRRV